MNSTNVIPTWSSSLGLLNSSSSKHLKQAKQPKYLINPFDITTFGC